MTVHVVAAVTCMNRPTVLCSALVDAGASDGLAGFADWAMGTPLHVALIVVVAFIAQRVLRSVLARALARWEVAQAKDATGVDAAAQRQRLVGRKGTLAQVAFGAATGFVVLSASFAALGELGVNLAPLLASAGVVGVAIGFGAQTLVKDYVSGAFLLIEDQLGVGDVVDVGVAVGVVEAMSLRRVRIRDDEGTVWHVPNSEIRRVGNRSQSAR
jgi:small-conductance mechanosensitive channel